MREEKPRGDRGREERQRTAGARGRGRWRESRGHEQDRTEWEDGAPAVKGEVREGGADGRDRGTGTG